MKRCSQCGNEVPESKTICSECEAFANDLEFADASSNFESGYEFDEPLDEPLSGEAPAMAAAPAATAAPAASAPATATAKPARPANRRMVLAGLLVVLGGTLTFAMFRPAPAVPVPVPAPKPAARPGSKQPAPKPPAQNTAATATPAPAGSGAPATSAVPAPAATPAPAPGATPAVATPAPAPAAAAPTVAPAPVAAPAPAPKPAATPAPAPVAAAAPVAPVVSKWSAANNEWLVNAKKGVAFQLRAEKKVVIWQGVAHPTLVVRCDAGKMQMFVYTASALQMEAQDENHTVRVTVDGDAEVTERWADSSDHDALFVPDPTALARRLLTASNLRVSYTPHNAAKVQADFQVAGLSSVLQQTAKQCGWK